MNELSLVIEILLIHALAVASPGPDFLVVTKNALNYNRTIGVYTAIGVAAGIAIHVIYGIAGIALLIEKNPAIYNVIKVAGALYLIFIGIQSFRLVNKKKIINKAVGQLKEKSSFSAFKNGFITNVLNPKATLFFLSIFSVMIPPQTPKKVLFILAFFLILNTGLWFVLVARVFTRKKVQVMYYKVENKINISFGIILILFAIKMLFF